MQIVGPERAMSATLVIFTPHPPTPKLADAGACVARDDASYQAQDRFGTGRLVLTVALCGGPGPARDAMAPLAIVALLCMIVATTCGERISAV